MHILAEEMQTKTLHFGFDLHLHILHFAFVVFDLNLLASMSGDEEGFARFSSQNLPTEDWRTFPRLLSH